MPNTIHLKSQSCPSCKRGLEQWTMKVVVVGLNLGTRCPACHEFVPLIVSSIEVQPATETKKGEDDYREGASTGEKETQHPEDLTTNKEE